MQLLLRYHSIMGRRSGANKEARNRAGLFYCQQQADLAVASLFTYANHH